MAVCLERGADLHMVQLMPLPLTVSCFSKIQIGFTFLVPAHLGSPIKGPLNRCCCCSTTSRLWKGVAECYLDTNLCNLSHNHIELEFLIMPLSYAVQKDE